MARIQIFENFSVINVATFDTGALIAQSSLFVHGVYIPGSISFNTIAMLFSNNATNQSDTIAFGLYSLSGSTLSLANSASGQLTLNNQIRWLSLVTSATQDITPGNWYFAYFLSSNSSGQFSVPFVLAHGVNFAWISSYGGLFVRGFYSATVSAFPASIATSDFTKEGTSGQAYSGVVPYVLISA